MIGMRTSKDRVLGIFIPTVSKETWGGPLKDLLFYSSQQHPLLLPIEYIRPSAD